DEPKVNGGFDYKGFTPSEGAHKLVAIPYSGSNGTGVKGISKIIQFTIINTPKISNLILINAEADKEIKAIAKETSTYINYKEIGSQLINIRADHDFVKVGSMKFVLNGEVRIENAAPFTWAGDAPKAGGGTDYKGFTLAPGYYDLIVTPYSQADGKGTAGSSYKATLYVSPDSYRIAAPDAEPGAQQASFTVAPNPFSHTANLSFTAAESGPATVEIYSMQGMLIERLYKGNVESGKSYKWEFNAKQLPSGFYMGRIQAGGQLIQQKMILSR
ncbi:MAG TPA: T9SS type A sorting domain-containing protein, partial [Phormidium sp.]